MLSAHDSVFCLSRKVMPPFTASSTPLHPTADPQLVSVGTNMIRPPTFSVQHRLPEVGSSY
jgi:hypothetical protein